MQMFKGIFPILILLLLGGCSSTVKPPQYTVINGEKSTEPMEATAVDRGWEFRFPKQYVQNVAITHDGDLPQLAFYAKTEGRWEAIKTVDIGGASLSKVPLNLTTDAIRLVPQSEGAGGISLCQFYVGTPPKKVFSVPLERPPFLEP
jgi:hypothetical protein